MEDNNIDGLTTTVDVLNAVKDNIGKDNDKAVELIDQLLNSGSGAFGPQGKEE